MTMNCTDIQDELVAFVLSELNPIERANIERHLASGCCDCNLQLMAIRESVELLWQTVPNNKLTDDFQRQLVTRVLNSAAEVEVESVAAELNRTVGKSSLIRTWPVQSLIAFAAGLLIAASLDLGTSDRAGRSFIDASQSNSSETVSLASPQFPGKLELAERQNESTHLVSLRKNAGASDELRGFVLWDSLASEIHLYCFGLNQPPKDSQYSLWLIGPSIAVRAAERLDVDANGNCKAVFDWPDGEFHFVQVTIEPTSLMNSRPSDAVELTSNVLPLLPH